MLRACLGCGFNGPAEAICSAICPMRHRSSRAAQRIWACQPSLEYSCCCHCDVRHMCLVFRMLCLFVLFVPLEAGKLSFLPNCFPLLLECVVFEVLLLCISTCKNVRLSACSTCLVCHYHDMTLKMSDDAHSTPILSVLRCHSENVV